MSGTGQHQCCPAGCECPGDPCPFCDECPGVPATVLFTLAGNSTCPAWVFPAANYNGDYELTQLAGACQWEYDDGTVEVVLSHSVLAPNWQVTVRPYIVPGNKGAGLGRVFLGQAFLVGNDCCRSFTASNLDTDCTTADGFGGTGTGTPCA